MLQPNDKIGPYTLVSELGKGSSCTAWLAERRGKFATTQVAIKIPFDQNQDLKAIAQESQLWATVGNHPNILPIIEAEEYDGRIVIVSEYAPDGTLDKWLKSYNGQAPSVETAMTMTCGMLAGLAHLHSKNIIHRDLKPANIMLQGEIPRLADFGIARLIKSSVHSGSVAGTPKYMSPEAFFGERCKQSDIWSIGVIFYEMLTGRLPFSQVIMNALIISIVEGSFEPLPHSIPPEIQEVIIKSLQKDPANRFHSATEMRNAIQHIHNKIANIISSPRDASTETAVTVIPSTKTLDYVQDQRVESVSSYITKEPFYIVIKNPKPTKPGTKKTFKIKNVKNKTHSTLSPNNICKPLLPINPYQAIRVRQRLSTQVSVQDKTVEDNKENIITSRVPKHLTPHAASISGLPRDQITIAEQRLIAWRKICEATIRLIWLPFVAMLGGISCLAYFYFFRDEDLILVLIAAVVATTVGGLVGFFVSWVSLYWKYRRELENLKKVMQVKKEGTKIRV
ncbi:MAG: protein kinase [Acidobacteriota bacterium]